MKQISNLKKKKNQNNKPHTYTQNQTNQKNQNINKSMYSAGKRIVEIAQNANRLHTPEVWGTYTPASLPFPYPRHKEQQRWKCSSFLALYCFTRCLLFPLPSRISLFPSGLSLSPTPGLMYLQKIWIKIYHNKGLHKDSKLKISIK